MDCYLRQEWHDERLTFKGPLPVLTLNIKMLEALWKPDTFFHNGLGSYIHMITRPNKLFRITQDGRILYSMRITQDERILYSMRAASKAQLERIKRVTNKHGYVKRDECRVLL
ncbi:hypothetical protein HAZT_HAZT002353 [Hyalella azteca]|uniref:Neurotransmitter-gated ion-channel ligand-binding domain-containing protein n=1 Tax=Hyalella azteca TaxID=294128 RepID=A0A6A0HCE1_HYAAZ|nr:hypothetical protein HAZT_HAZT002353 [Hyalella azteca]